MSIPTNKDELLLAITTTYEKLFKELVTISEAQASQKNLPGHVAGSFMSVENLVSYLIGWGELVLKWGEKDTNGEEIDFPETGYNWSELGKLAQKFYDDYADLSYGELLKRFTYTVEKIISSIKNMSNKELYGENWYKNYTKGRMIQLNTSSPYKNAYARIGKWKKEYL